MAARLSIIVPTPDGEGLDQLLASVDPQLAPGDEVLIIGDTHSRPLTHLAALIEGKGAPYRFLPYDAGHHCWGHCQINYGLTQARGDYLVFIDDDDVFTPDALSIIRQRIALLDAPRVLMFKFHCQRLGRTLPERYEAVESAIGGHCIVPPNIPTRLGRWACRYAGDYDFIVETLSLWPKDANGIIWWDDIISIAR